MEASLSDPMSFAGARCTKMPGGGGGVRFGNRRECGSGSVVGAHDVRKIEAA